MNLLLQRDRPRFSLPPLEVERAGVRGGHAAFTLVELVISSSLMAMILVSAYVCLHAAISTQKLIEPRVEVLQTARVALALMSADLRSACPLSKDFEFLGMHRLLGEVAADNLDFATHHYVPHHAREADFCEVSFFLDQDPGTGHLSLWRRRHPTIAPDPLSGGQREELAKGVAGLRFDYYDGFDWFDSWGDVERHGKQQASSRYHGNLSGMPEAVRITLWLEPNPKPKKPDAAGSSGNEPPLMFQTVARLNLAASLRSRGSSSTSASTNQPASSGLNQGGNQ